MSFLFYDLFLSDDFLPSSPVTMLSRVDNFPKKVFGGISADNFRLENFGSIDVSRIRSLSTHNEMKSRVCNVSFLRGCVGRQQGGRRCGNENFTKPIGLISKRTILYVHHTFFS